MIDVADLGKSFTARAGKRRIDAVRHLSFRAADGAITGLLGPNGAGKTTTLRIIATLIPGDTGGVRVDGFDSVDDALAVRARMGVLSDARGLYTRLTARENIRYYGQLRGMSDAEIAASTDNLAALIDMRNLLDRRTEGFSQGERMKVAIARAMVHDPHNLVLDEPSNGLDINSTRALRDLLRHLRGAGKCVLLSSHIMQEVSALCDHVVVIAQGSAVAQGTTADLIAAAGAVTLEDAFVTLTSRVP